MQRPTKAKRLGQILLARAMIAAGHCPADTASRCKCEPSTIYRILSGHHNAGMSTAARIEAVYPDVYTRSWLEPPGSDDRVPRVPRGRPGAKPQQQEAA